MNGEPVAAGITVGFKEYVEIPWASSLKRFNKFSPNMCLYWEAMKTGVSDGYRTFDFGRSTKDSGTYRFKAQWGAEPRPLAWYYIAAPTDVPDVNPKSGGFSLLSRAWQNLPLPVANTLGPIITKSIP